MVKLILRTLQKAVQVRLRPFVVTMGRLVLIMVSRTTLAEVVGAELVTRAIVAVRSVRLTGSCKKLVRLRAFLGGVNAEAACRLRI